MSGNPLSVPSRITEVDKSRPPLSAIPLAEPSTEHSQLRTCLKTLWNPGHWFWRSTSHSFRGPLALLYLFGRSDLRIC
ncbi:hypothetical protein [Pseudarthrobacter sp. SSS035]|uniref:hypothetical protein n=1 Tax=Pseudarthrobacter sp. SSS035 TaxID=2931399 RepID=UPI0035305E7F